MVLSRRRKAIQSVRSVAACATIAAAAACHVHVTSSTISLPSSVAASMTHLDPDNHIKTTPRYSGSSLVHHTPRGGGGGSDGGDKNDSSNVSHDLFGKSSSSSSTTTSTNTADAKKKKKGKFATSSHDDSSKDHNHVEEETSDTTAQKSLDDNAMQDKKFSSKTASSLPRQKAKEKSPSSDHSHESNKSSFATKGKVTDMTPIQSYILKESDYYNILGLHEHPRTAITSAAIQKAYRRRCVVTHPDKVPNGDRTAFDKVTEAFNVLSDDNKRALYDRYGIDGIKKSEENGIGGMSGGQGFGDEIFRQFFGGFPGSADGSHFFQSSRQSSNKPRNRNLRYQLEVSLEELYNGAHRTVSITQPASGTRKTVELTLPRGIAHGQSVRLPGEVDHVADATPADVIFILAQRHHPVFTRKANDLAIEVTLSLSEAICGFQRTITHLDGRKLTLQGPVIPGSSVPMLVQNGDVHVLKGEGMPKKSIQNMVGGESNFKADERCEAFGDLYVQYKVQLPLTKPHSIRRCEENLTSDERDQLRRLLDKLVGHESTFEPPSDLRPDGSRASTGQRLRVASATDFGRASGTLETNQNHDDTTLHSDDEEENTFREGFRFFSSSGPRKSTFFSSTTASTDESGNVQCQQM